jgi:hypothetical protein
LSKAKPLFPLRPALLLILLLAAPAGALAAPAIVSVLDKGRPTQCAEEDNVYAAVAGPSVRRFTVTARQPAYGRRLKRDIRAPNFKGCAITAAHDFAFTPRQVTLYDNGQVRVRGVTYPRYWRAEAPAVEVAGRRDRGFHLLQLFVRRGGRMQEILVLHAADGYWRLRPLPLPQFREALYGSSFLIGPIQEEGRPFVRIASVRIDPVRMRFTVLFADGGQASVTVTHIDRRALKAAVALDPAIGHGPFLALRSMYVGPRNADAAQLRWTDSAAHAHQAPAVGFGTVQAKRFSFARPLPSRHNASAPDLAFSRFEDRPSRHCPKLIGHGSPDSEQTSQQRGPGLSMGSAFLGTKTSDLAQRSR